MSTIRLCLSTLLVIGMTGCVTHREPAGPAPLRVETNFPGGAVEVVGIDPVARLIRIKPPAHPGRGWECWWYFKVTGVRSGEVLTVEVNGSTPFALPDQAHWSSNGRDWRQTAPGVRKDGAVTFQQRVIGREAWFAWGPPFNLADARTLVRSAAWNCQDATIYTLTRSADGRLVPALRVMNGPPTAGRPVIWVQARQHAWESGSSWVGKGFVDWLVSDDSRALNLRRSAEIHVVPIMDVDNVERGAGGKNQQPQDHNRDWSDDPHWPEVRAAQKRIGEAAEQGRFRLFIDLHNPAPNDREPMFFVVPEDQLSDRQRSRLASFLKDAREEMVGPLKLSQRTRATGSNYDANWDRISKIWVQRHGGDHCVAVTLETSWNTPDSNVAGYEQIGRELGLAVERWLTDHP